MIHPLLHHHSPPLLLIVLDKVEVRVRWIQTSRISGIVLDKEVVVEVVGVAVRVGVLRNLALLGRRL